MNPVIELLREPAAIAALGPEWDALVKEAADGFEGLDATSTHAWFQALCAAFPQAASPLVFVARESSAEGRLIGVLPLVSLSQNLLGARTGLATELYGGRNGPLLVPEHAEQVLSALLRMVARRAPGWSKLQLTLPQGRHAEHLRRLCGQLGWRWHEDKSAEACGFSLPSDLAGLDRMLPSKMRQNLRTARNKINKLGLQPRVQTFTQVEQATELLNTVLAIERGSWKHEAGSAITNHPQQQAFYTALFPHAMQARLLCAVVMYLGEEAIAYNFGILRDGVFCCLKHSQLQSQDALSPSSLLMQDLLQSLIQQGVRRFDWMGLVEPHKLRWSAENQHYGRQSFWLYNPGWRGQALACWTWVRQGAKRQLASPGTDATDSLAAPLAPPHCKVWDATQALEHCETAWRDMARDHAQDLSGLDASASPTWFSALLASRKQAQEGKVLALLQGEEIKGLMPLFCEGHALLGQHVRWTTELYGGRNALLVQQPDLSSAKALMKGLDKAYPTWVSLKCTVTKGTPHTLLLHQACAALGMGVQSQGIEASPYVHLLESAEKFREGVSRSLLRNLRRSTREAEAKGQLRWQEYSAPEHAKDLLAMMMEVERNSWKHEAGTAVSCNPDQEAFYRAYLPAALQNGQLYALALCLNDVPISYQLGTQNDRVYSCLKNSMHQGFGELRPSHMLKLELFDRLRARGIQTVDLMGVAEPHKLVWADPTPLYERETLTILRANWRGRAWGLWNELRHLAAVSYRLVFKPSAAKT